MSNTLGNLDWNNPATVIAFAVDNNPQAVAAEMVRRDYKIQGLSIDQYKVLLMMAYEKGLDLTWIGNLQYMPTAGNWTGELFRQTQANANAKFTWENLGQVLALAGSALITIFGVKPTGGAPSTTPTPENTTIMGISKDLFYPLLMILLVIIVLVIFVVMRKK